jgi:hypothetical protein
MIYGHYADDVLGGDGFFHDDQPLCRVYWNGPALDKAGIANFVATRKPYQVAVGLQSFVGTPVADIRAALSLNP